MLDSNKVDSTFSVPPPTGHVHAAYVQKDKEHPTCGWLSVAHEPIWLIPTIPVISLFTTLLNSLPSSDDKTWGIQIYMKICIEMANTNHAHLLQSFVSHHQGPGCVIHRSNTNMLFAPRLCDMEFQQYIMHVHV